MRPIMKSDTAARKVDEQDWHVDDFIDNPYADPYARWMFMHFRLPSFQKAAFEPFMRDHKLFCTYQGSRYRVTGASTMGDVWLVKDFNKDHGYDHRVLVAACSNWGPK